MLFGGLLVSIIELKHEKILACDDFLVTICISKTFALGHKEIKYACSGRLFMVCDDSELNLTAGSSFSFKPLVY